MSLITRYLIAAVIVVSDQITKIAVNRSLELYEQIPITSFFNITKAYNYGAAFSFLDIAGGAQRWFFTIISFVVSVILIVWLYRLPRQEKLMGLSLSLILGGAIGNLIDRFWYGYVVDFIQVYGWGYYFPSFNIADAAISCGAALMLYLTFFDKPEDRANLNQVDH